MWNLKRKAKESNEQTDQIDKTDQIDQADQTGQTGQTVHSFHWGFVDQIAVFPHGVLRIGGWTFPSVEVPEFQVISNGEPIRQRHVYRVFRPDVAANQRTDNHYLGFTAEYLLPGIAQDVSVEWNGARLWSSPVHPYSPDYGELFRTPEVLHRDHIYSSGPPVRAISPEVWQLINKLTGKVLDFGCGSGFAVMKLREAGVDACGLELDRAEIREHLIPEVADRVKLYDGRFPIPYGDEEFDHAYAVEVIEHVPDYETAVRELHRVARHSVLITVPDISSIPRLHRHHVVPWHLLEGTHVNFFNQESLHRLLGKYFSTVIFHKIGAFTVNGEVVYDGLAALCRK